MGSLTRGSGVGRELEQIQLLQKLLEQQQRTNELLEVLVNSVMASR